MVSSGSTREARVHIVPISLVEHHPEAAKDFLDIDKVTRVTGSVALSGPSENRPTPEVGKEGNASKKPPKDVTEAGPETPETEKKGSTEVKQTQLNFTDIHLAEQRTPVPVASSCSEVPRTELRLTDRQPGVSLESSLPPLEDPSVILLSPSGLRLGLGEDVPDS